MLATGKSPITWALECLGEHRASKRQSLDAHIMLNEQAKRARAYSAYSAWLDKSVLLWVRVGELRTVLNCTLVGESEAAVRIRVGGLWDLDIYKEMILAVEEAEVFAN
jgi:hypothetical protein